MQAQSFRSQLIADHADIARRIALKVARRCPDWVEKDDLVAAGMVGLTEAAQRFDESRAEPFLGFAERRIRGAVLDELRRGDLLSRRARKLARDAKRAIRAIEASGAVVTDELVANALGLTVVQYRTEVADLVNVEIESIDEDFAKQQVCTKTSPDEAADKHRMLTKVRAALDLLGARDAQLLSLHFLEELTYAEVGSVLGITPSRVCQLMSRALERLRALV